MISEFPDFPEISNLEFYCLFLLKNGPTVLRDLQQQMINWRKGQITDPHSDLWAGPGTYYYENRPNLKEMYENFILFESKHKINRLVVLSPKGFQTVAKMFERLKEKQVSQPVLKKYYVLFQTLDVQKTYCAPIVKEVFSIVETEAVCNAQAQKQIRDCNHKILILAVSTDKKYVLRVARKRGAILSS